ncbi:von Willebrand factor type A domain-containing protein [Granulicatella balaenopterae]|uniref:von Willebrand factor type A domain-containing protein n=1 Tax=Granulicatella balaenopterae TaxID=137733 RepID=A0A1H9I9V0_9LACT|nr:VWA domain-containing protein [Granulicatella balaenopterae]SEQ71347.1 von Willebrand factor type A domain-containing protein [Granulicatella balaenopterae]
MNKTIYKCNKKEINWFLMIMTFIILIFNLDTAPFSKVYGTPLVDDLQKVEISMLEKGNQVILIEKNSQITDKKALTHQNQIETIDLTQIDQRFLFTFEEIIDNDRVVFSPEDFELTKNDLDKFDIYLIHKREIGKDKQGENNIPRLRSRNIQPNNYVNYSSINSNTEDFVKITVEKQWQNGSPDMEGIVLVLKNHDWEDIQVLHGAINESTWTSTIQIPKKYNDSNLQIEELASKKWENTELKISRKNEWQPVTEIKENHRYVIGTKNGNYFYALNGVKTDIEEASEWTALYPDTNKQYYSLCMTDSNNQYLGKLAFVNRSPVYEENYNQYEYRFQIDNNYLKGWKYINNKWQTERIDYYYGGESFGWNFYGYDSNSNNLPENNRAVLYEKVEPIDKITITNQKKQTEDAVEEKFEYHKTIDAFRDNEENPDTDLDNKALDKTDLYRLYLTAKARIQEPVPTDFLFVVDQSYSMASDDILLEGQNKTIPRDRAISDILNGSDGIIAQALSLHQENSIAVIGFAGDAFLTNYQDYTYHKDANIIVPWTQQLPMTVDVKAKYHQGTNYEAGLKLANEMFNQKNNHHKKIMIFLGDGIPTFFIIDQYDKEHITTIKNSGYGYGYNFKDNYLKRWGTGIDDKTNYPFCILASEWAFNDFLANNPNVTTYTIGILKDVDESKSIYSINSEVLEYYAYKGSGRYFSVGDRKNIYDTFDSIIKADDYTHLVITDQLSEYVDFHEQKDIKITKKINGIETILYENEQSIQDDNGNDIVQSVETNGKEIIVTFSPMMRMENEAEYSVSFNIKTTPYAYKEYETNGYGDSKGDLMTDYGTNKTSSDKEGFYSNDMATVSYKHNATSKTHQYDKPVIQVDTNQLDKTTIEVVKRWIDDDINRPNEIQVDLQIKKDQQWVSQTKNIYQENIENPVILHSENDWHYIWNNVPAGEYRVVEQNIPEGYEVNISNENGNFIITNIKKLDYELPNTGKFLGEYIYWVLGSAMVFVAISLLKKSK